MTDSIRNQIADRIVTDISAIATGGGYHYTVPTGGCVRESRIGYDTPPSEFPMVDVVVGAERRIPNPTGELECECDVLLTCSVRGIDLPALENFIADVEHCMQHDATINGLAIYAYVQLIDTDGGTWEHSTAVLTLHVKYVRPFGSE